MMIGLDVPGLERPATLREDDDALVLRLPATPGRDVWSLAHERAGVRAGSASDVQCALMVAQHVATILAHLADQGVVHGRIDVHHVIVDSEREIVTLADFGAARFARAVPADPDERVLQHADDLRGLGRILYGWFTRESRWPDEADRGAGPPHDPLGTVLRDPILDTVGVPPAVQALVLRLLEAGRPGGYRHARAVVDAVKRLQQAGDAHDTLATALGVPPDLNPTPARLGRDDAVNALMEAYADVTGRSAAAPGRAAPQREPGLPLLALVDGVAGVGKTAVLGDACRAMARLGARVASGKFNQFGDSRPLWALAQALDDVVHGWLGAPPAVRASMAQRIRDALLDLAQVIVEAVPSLGLLLGPQPEPPSLPGEANQLRFELLMRRFVGVLARHDEPLVLVLDDLQWADPVTLDMLRSLLRAPEVRHLCVLGAYRREAVCADHPLLRAIQACTADGSDVRRIAVDPWTEHDVRGFVASAGLAAAPATDVLAGRLVRIMNGNPLGVLQALRRLHDGGALHYAASDAAWQVDLDAAERLLAGCRVVDLFGAQLAGLPAAIREALSTAACLGAEFSIETLATVLGKGAEPTLHLLWPALRGGLVIVDDDSLEADAAPLRLRLVHDLVQQAAHALAGADGAASRHAQIGRALLASYTHRHQVGDHVFEVVQHFNHAGDALTASDEREQIVALNVMAGRLARRRGAAAAARGHFEHALRLLSPQADSRQPAAAFDLAWETAEAAYLMADFDRLDVLAGHLEQSPPGPIAAARALELRIQGLLARNRLGEALRVGEEALGLLDVMLEPLIPPDRWPAVPTAAELNVPVREDPRVDTALRVLVWLTPCAYITSFELYARVILTMVRLAIAHPGSALTAASFVNYGLTLCGIGRPQDGFEAGERALALSTRGRDDTLRCKVATLAHGFLRHWRLSAAKALQPLLETFQACLLCGDREYAGYAAFLYCDKAWGLTPLADLAHVHARHTRLVEEFGHEFSWRHCRVWLQFVRSLQGRGVAALALRGDAFDDTLDFARLESADNRFSLFTAHVLNGWLAWHRGDSAAALQSCRRADTVAMTAVATLLSVDHRLLSCLCRIEVARGEPDAVRAETLSAVETDLKLLQAWADKSPDNVAHKCTLVEAELARARGDVALAWHRYEHAAALVEATPFLHDQALTAERIAGFYREQGHERLAVERLHHAYAVYSAWGATAIVDAFLDRHAGLLGRPAGRPVTTRDVGLTLGDRLAALLAEYGLDRVVVDLDGLDSVLVCDPSAEGAPALTRLPRDGDGAQLPHGLLEAGRQAADLVVIAEPADDARWSSDPYLARRRPAAVALWPVRRGTQVLGCLALEVHQPRLLSAAYLGDRLAWHVQAVVDELRAEQLSERLHESTRLEPVTGLPNRSAFVRNLDLAHARRRACGTGDAVVAVVQVRDFDQRAMIEGHDRGDALRLAIARRLIAATPNLERLGVLDRHRYGVIHEGRSLSGVVDACRALRADLAVVELDGSSVELEPDVAVCADDGERDGAAALRCAESVFDLTAPDERRDVIVYDPTRHPARVQSHQRTEAMLRQQTRLRHEAEERDREKSKFIASAVHDLQQPLQAIGTALEPVYHAIQAGDFNQAERLLEVVRRSSYLMRDQFSAILDISRLESGVVRARYTDLDLVALLQSVLDQVAPNAAARSVQTGLRLESDGRYFVRSDAQLLRRLVLNLVNNGIRYRANGRPGGAHVLLHVRVEGTVVRLDVADNGVGIEPALIESQAIFQPYFQARAGSGPGEGGVGLGLAIVRVILDLMPDHALGVRSQIGEGTCFRLAIPMSRLGVIGNDIVAPDLAQARQRLKGAYVLLTLSDATLLDELAALLGAYGALTERVDSMARLRALVAEIERTPDLLVSSATLADGTSAQRVQDTVAAALGTVPMLACVEATADASRTDAVALFDAIAARLAGASAA